MQHGLLQELEILLSQNQGKVGGPALDGAASLSVGVCPTLQPLGVIVADFHSLPLQRWPHSAIYGDSAPRRLTRGSDGN